MMNIIHEQHKYTNKTHNKRLVVKDTQEEDEEEVEKIE